MIQPAEPHEGQCGKRCDHGVFHTKKTVGDQKDQCRDDGWRDGAFCRFFDAKKPILNIFQRKTISFPFGDFPIIAQKSGF